MPGETSLGKAILLLLRRSSLSRADLAAKSRIKKETLDRAIAGKTAVRSETRKRIARGFGVSPEKLFEIESQFLNASGETNNEGEDRSTSRDILLLQILENVKGLPLAVARSIVAAFEEDGDGKTPGEIESILRRKAIEYRALKAQLLALSEDDPAVKRLRDEALEAIERGEFDQARSRLKAAREIDRSVRIGAENVVITRRRSESETLLSEARLLALTAQYQQAVSVCIEVRSLLAGTASTMEGAALVMAAEYLNAECQEVGADGTAEANIARIEHQVLPFSRACSLNSYLATLAQLADLYALHGYRLGSSKVLGVAARKFRELCEALPESESGELRLESLIGLGDCHVEIGLNRKSLYQARLGLGIMRRILEDISITVPPEARSATLIRYGTAYANVGLISDQIDDFEKSAGAYESAMGLIRGLDQRVTQARAYWGLAIALAGQGKRQGSTEVLRRSEQACDDALKEITREKYPVDWSTIIQNRGNAKLYRGALENGVETLYSAIEDFVLALETRTKRRFALGYVKSKGNMAIAKKIIAEREASLELAVAAKVDVENAINATLPGSEYFQKYYGEEKEQIEQLIERLEVRRK
jgi:plasmid maintenance system antidote protein VapI/tetratricopeptide (TPR) repeat protein